ncbi:hypothetical protein DKX38_001078 [Salix brachista]|uniref:Uncharacterized protein n=1 Tax=Salix brachista TaxID=2182728 RepID=A0A5N5P287_9ROSI|nr:hypothetical protein DKX38_001078 [Salix brachista]
MGRKSTAVATRKMIKKEPHRLNSAGGVTFKGCEEPRLVRSSGMRRDWSFEDLMKALSNEWSLVGFHADNHLTCISLRFIIRIAEARLANNKTEKLAQFQGKEMVFSRKLGINGD